MVCEEYNSSFWKLIRLLASSARFSVLCMASWMFFCPFSLRLSFSMISLRGALIMVSGVRMSCAACVKKLIFSSEVFRSRLII